jgi:O-antigen/teichoic acid export membrane protein
MNREDFTLIKLSQAVLASGDVFLVSLLVGFEEAALYTVATRVASLAGFALNTVAMLYGPRLSAAAHDEVKLRQLTWRATGLSIAGSVPVVLLLVAAREPLLRTFGESYDQAAGLLMILLIGAAANAAFGPIGTVVNVNGQERVSRNVMLSAAVAFVPAVAFSTHLWGANGAAWAWVCVTVGWNTVLWVVTDFSFADEEQG